MRRFSGRTELTPLVQSGGTVALEIGSGVEVAFLVEEVEDRGVDPQTWCRDADRGGGAASVTGPGADPSAGRRHSARVISGLLWKYLNGSRFVMNGRYETVLPISTRFVLTMLRKGLRFVIQRN
jgi:hypothetical protein